MEIFIPKLFRYGGLHLQGLLTNGKQKNLTFRSCWSSDMLPWPLLASARDEGVVDAVVVVEVGLELPMSPLCQSG
jgi:hypothetical protein